MATHKLPGPSVPPGGEHGCYLHGVPCLVDMAQWPTNKQQS